MSTPIPAVLAMDWLDIVGWYDTAIALGKRRGQI
jgi:hypothetical protein